MARYRKIDPRMWGDEKFRRLSPIQPSGQALWLYLLTGPHNNVVPGLFSIGEGGLSERLRWPVEAFRKAFQEGLLEGLFEYDGKALVVSIPKAIKYDPPASPNVVTSWATGVDEIPECELKDKHMWGLRESLKGFHKGFAKAFDEAFPKGLAYTTTTTTTTETPTTTDTTTTKNTSVDIKKETPILRTLQKLSDHHAELFGRHPTKVKMSNPVKRVLKELDRLGEQKCYLVHEGHKILGRNSDCTSWLDAYPAVKRDGEWAIMEPDTAWVDRHIEAAEQAKEGSADTSPSEAPPKPLRSQDQKQDQDQEKNNTPRQRQKQARSLPRNDQISLLVDQGVKEQVAGDYITLRERKRAPLTKTALGGIRREASKAGIPLQEALEVCCANGWQGFRADWYQKGKQKTGEPSYSDYGKNRRL